MEICRSVKGLDPASQELIQYLDWKMDDLADIMDFCAEMPLNSTVRLVTVCREVFECSEDVKFEDFKNVQVPIGTGRLREMSASLIQKWKEDRDLTQMNLLLERLGVVIKPRPKMKDDSGSHKDFAWLPLTAALNPIGYRKIQEGLSYDPETYDEEMETRNKLRELEDPDARDREFGGRGNTKRELMVSTLSGDRGVSLTMLPKAEFVALMRREAIGFVSASQEGVDMRTYRSATERNMNPKLLAERDEELSRLRDSELKKLEESADGTVTVRSRWRSRNSS